MGAKGPFSREPCFELPKSQVPGGADKDPTKQENTNLCPASHPCLPALLQLKIEPLPSAATSGGSTKAARGMNGPD